METIWYVLFYEAKEPIYMGIAQYRNVAKPLSTRDSYATSHHLQIV